MPATKTETTLRLHRLEISSFMGIRGTRIDARGRHVLITGPNGAGKSSTVDSIWACLGGMKSAELPEPIHRGDDKAEVTLDLGEFIVTRAWQADKRPKLTITTKDGATAGADILKGFLASYALDPVAFLARRPQDQIDDVLGVAEIPAPVDQVAEITGERHEPLPNESADAYLQRLGGYKTGTYYVRRTAAHQGLDRAKKALAESRDQLERIGGPVEAGAEISTGEILKRLEALERKADNRRALEDAAKRAQATLEETQLVCKRRVDEWQAACAEVERLEKQLAQAKAEAERLQGVVANNDKVLVEDQAEAAARAEALAKVSDPAADIQAARAELRQAEGRKLAQAERQVMSRQVERLQCEVNDCQNEYDTLDAVLTRLRHQRQNLLNGVELGVEGLEIGDGELRLNGVPFKQASTSERLRVACAVAMLQRPRLRLLRVDDGEHLDANSRELLFRIADANDFQVIFTAVADTKDLRVEILDA